MAEHFLLRTKGGPYPGTRHVNEGDRLFRFLPDPAVRWPLPGELLLPGEPAGRYVKVSEGPLEIDGNDSHAVVRGAEYEWRENAD